MEQTRRVAEGRGVSQRTNAQTQHLLMDLTLDELVRTVTQINTGLQGGRTRRALIAS